MSTTRRLRATRPAAPALEPGIARIRREMDLPQAFPDDVLSAAAQAAANPRLPDEDRSDIPFVTVDPPGAMDLDQALRVARDGDGFVVYYAIADVAAFVTPGDPVDLEANRRGETLYGANDKVPLHPPALSEDAASLLPGQLRPALLWTIRLDRTGEGTELDVRRAMVRSRQRLDYEGVQQAIDAGQADPMFEVLREIGELRMQREVRRGGVSLPLPDQEIRGEGSNWRLEFRARCPIEDWNEQISLLTGMAAAHLMLEHGVGLLRTLPEPPPRAIGRLRRSARALGIDWPASRNYPDFIRSLDPANPRHVAMLVSCTSVLRGAGYVAFEGDPPAHPMHSALASTYTHVTAPLRRLVDRYTGELCVALCAGTPVPQWVLDALPGLPRTMAASSQRSGRYERAVIDLAETLVLAPHVGELFDASIVEVDDRDPARGVAMLHALAIEAPVSGTTALPLGDVVRVRLQRADPGQRLIDLEWIP
ncbi:RNB domain-containing ribonuclease [Luteimonas sp. 8-5]|uniref:RNB domain-containing ribonuclease n=1 Tax=Luteimonas sp. 8-5 TaxID=3039387 RepID=UPI002436FF29|nr:RNB domain-containing ribonuclease [Luteimonas sp. 8-5]MDG6349057.1 RNB domain-containing ribonuclease [Luteimonas sp. 8-5]